ncbi:uncharacterized protein BDZ83DRAFT_378114 [Colletotrichum acutatum]|uniref:Uncharacterized protein n=1 Tax=Glomerella acutata TaxID=27357 RepID=A0AAD9D1Q7_GLOAC|nr:uncharacterized protein BDZ83DRAFT_378114 [Colletotrichum acutatum]KAK1730642.1 hypothetical protein BDZ83DRAFT_378114 [Colletotrichum acutatum]
MRAQIPACEKTKSLQQQSRDLARADEYSKIMEIDAMIPYETGTEDEVSLHDNFGLATNDEREANQDHNILYTLSGIDMEFDQNTPSSWRIDERLLLASSSLTMNFLTERSQLGHEQEECNDEGCYPEDTLNYDVDLEAFGSPFSPRPPSYFGRTSEPNSEADSEAHRSSWDFDLADTSLPPLTSMRELVGVGPGNYSDRSDFGLDNEYHNDFGEGHDANDPQRQRSMSLISYSDWRSDEDEDMGPFSELSFQPTGHDRQPDDDGMYGEPELGQRPQDCIWPSEVLSGSEIDLYEDDQIE